MAGSAVAESPGEPRECWANGELEDVAEQQETAICQKSSTPGSRQVAVAKVWRAEKASWEYQSAVDGKGAVPRLLVRVLGFPWRIRQRGLCTAMCGLGSHTWAPPTKAMYPHPIMPKSCRSSLLDTHGGGISVNEKALSSLPFQEAPCVLWVIYP